MERIMSDEEKLRRAIEISQRRNNNYYRVATTRVNVDEKKDYRLFRKMILQIIICLLIYIIFYLITSTNYVFSAQVIENTNKILNYDINFSEIYNNFILFVNSNTDSNEAQEENNIILEKNNEIQTERPIIENNNTEKEVITEVNNLVEENKIEENKVEENKTEEKKADEEKNTTDNENKEEEIKNIATTQKEEKEKTQMELDAEEAKKICKFSKPLSGTITSEFGEREVISDVMSADHKGIDIATESGTSIKAAMSGTVSVAEENSEYGKFIKVVNEDVMTVYAHCKKLKVKVGDKVKIGQTIATVGSTGNSTGPHLHFEIRLKNRYINPRLLIDF